MPTAAQTGTYCQEIPRGLGAAIALLSAVLAVVACQTVHAWAQTAPPDIYQTNVQQKLEKELEYLAGQGYERFGKNDVIAILKGGQQKIEAPLKAGETYAVIAACDQDCTHVQLSLLTKTGQMMMKSPEAAPVVIINGSPPDSGVYVLQLDVPGCNSKACQGGVALARLKPQAITVESSTSAPQDPALSYDLAKRIQTELKRVGCYAGAADGTWADSTVDAIKAANLKAKSSLEAGAPAIDTLLKLTAITTKLCGPSCTDGQLAQDGKCVAKVVQKTPPKPAPQQAAKPVAEKSSDGDCFNRCIARVRWAPTCANRCAR